MKAAPNRVDDIDARLKALEAKAPKVIQKGRDCPKCGAEMELISEQPDEQHGSAGLKEHQLTCSCGMATSRKFMPGKGYL